MAAHPEPGNPDHPGNPNAEREALNEAYTELRNSLDEKFDTFSDRAVDGISVSSADPDRTSLVWGSPGTGVTVVERAPSESHEAPPFYVITRTGPYAEGFAPDEAERIVLGRTPARHHFTTNNPVEMRDASGRTAGEPVAQDVAKEIIPRINDARHDFYSELRSVLAELSYPETADNERVNAVQKSVINRFKADYAARRQRVLQERSSGQAPDAS